MGCNRYLAAAQDLPHDGCETAAAVLSTAGWPPWPSDSQIMRDSCLRELNRQKP
jgi:hypothetical protein